LKGVRERKYTRQAFLRIRGAFVSQHFPLDTPDAEIAEWQRNARAKGQLNQPQRVETFTGPTFAEDAAAYLKTVTSMPSYSDREHHIRQWVQVFGDRTRASLTAVEIRTQLEAWRRTLSASSCNKRRTALMSFFTRMNGKSGHNPVRDVEKYPEDAEPRAQHPVTIYRVLALMEPSKTRARLRVILTTGWPHAQVKRLKPEHLDLERGRAYVTPRRKGKGRKGAWLPLLPSAVAALREFVKWDAFTSVNSKGEPQPWSHSAMHKSWRLALGKLNARRKAQKLPPLKIRPYDLRHTAITWLANQITDERALQEFAMHSRIEQTRHYSEAATAGRLERAFAGLMKTKVAPPVAPRVAPRRRSA
jgi:integrase